MSTNVHAEFINLSVNDGTTMRVYVTRPEGATTQSGSFSFRKSE